MTETIRVCDHCGAPLRDLVDGFCPFCRTRPYAVGATFEAAPTAFSVVLLDAGRNKIEVIKQLRVLVDRDFGADLGLKEAKDLIDRANPGAPPALIVDVDAARARDWAETFARAGASVEVRPSASTAPPPAVAPPGTGAAFGVWLMACGRKKINVIKEIRGITDLGLKEAKDLADGADQQPQLLVRGLDEHDARLAASRLAGAGATAEVRPA